jgi:hypothetical protein
MSFALSLGVSATSLTRPNASAHAKKVRPDYAYFVGKTITWIAPGAPGGTYYGLATLMAPYMASYLHCVINVESLSTANGIPGQNAAAVALPNGLTIGELNPSEDVEGFIQGDNPLSFTMKNQDFIAGIPAAETIWVTNPATDHGANTAVKMLDPSNGLTFLDPTTGYQDLITRVVTGAYGVSTANLITGYSGGPVCSRGSNAVMDQGY